VVADLPVQPNIALAVLGADGTDPNVLMGDPMGYTSAKWNSTKPIVETDGVAYFEVTLPRLVSVSRVQVYGDYGAWERKLRDYDVQVFAGGEWRTVSVLRDNFYRNVIAHDFQPLTTDRVRLKITGVNTCLFKPGTIGWIKTNACLRGIEVYSAPQGKASAYFVHRAPRKVEIAHDESYVWRVTLKNITDAPVSGTLRIHTAAGLSVEQPSQPVRIPAGGEVEAEITVTVDKNAPAERLPLAAGLYDGERLISRARQIKTRQRQIEPKRNIIISIKK